jgi:hypothetical protein
MPALRPEAVRRLRKAGAVCVTLSSQVNAVQYFPESRIVTQKVIKRIDVDVRKKKGSGSSFLKHAIEIL